jgi:hypothetical protein
MNILHYKRKLLPMGCPQIGGSSRSESRNETKNTDNRVAVQDGIGLSSSSNNAISYNSTDAVKAISGMGADVIRASGAAVVELNRDAMAGNVQAWDTTVNAGAKLVDKLIDASVGLGASAIDKFQPADNKANDTSLKLGMIAAAGVAAVVIMGKMK